MKRALSSMTSVCSKKVTIPIYKRKIIAIIRLLQSLWVSLSEIRCESQASWEAKTSGASELCETNESLYLFKSDLFKMGVSAVKGPWNFRILIVWEAATQDINLFQINRVNNFGLTPEYQVPRNFQYLRICYPMLHANLRETFQRVDKLESFRKKRCALLG